MSAGRGNSLRDWRLGEHYVHALVFGCALDCHSAEDLLPAIRESIDRAEDSKQSGVCSLVDALTITVEFLSERAMEFDTVPTRRAIVVLAHLLAVQSNGPVVTQKTLQQELQTLTAVRRTMLQLRYLEFRKPDEIAVQLQLDRTEVEQQLAETRQQLLANLIPRQRAATGHSGRLEDEIPFRGTAADALQCSRYFDGLMTEAELLYFDQHVCTDVSFAREMAWHCRLHELLRRTLTAGAFNAVCAEDGSSGLIDAASELPRSAGTTVSSVNVTQRAVVATPVLLLLLVFCWILFSDGPQGIPRRSPEQSRNSSRSTPVLSVGRMSVQEKGSRHWRDTGDLVSGDRVVELQPGKGLVQLRNGIRIALRGPASFVIESADRLRLLSGSAVADSSGTAGSMLLAINNVRAVVSQGAIGIRNDYGVSTAVQSFVAPLSIEVADEERSELNEFLSLAPESLLQLQPGNPGGYVESGVDPGFRELWKLSLGIERCPEEWQISNDSVTVGRRGTMVLVPEGVIDTPESGIPVDLRSPGRLQFRVAPEDVPRVAGGVRVRGFRLSLYRPSEEGDVARVNGEIRFSHPVLGIIGRTSLLNETDQFFNQPVNVQKKWRGVEVGDGEESPHSVRDLVTLSADRRSVFISCNASVAVDEVRILVQHGP